MKPLLACPCRLPNVMHRKENVHYLNSVGWVCEGVRGGQLHWPDTDPSALSERLVGSGMPDMSVPMYNHIFT